MEQTKDELISSIEAAFSGVKLGSGVSWREADVIDDYGSRSEREAARAQDEKEDWTKIPFDLIGDLRYQAVLSFMDDEGLKFHLPACLIYFLKESNESDSAIIDSTLFTLMDERRIKNLKPLLDQAQQSCIINFLKWANDQEPHNSFIKKRLVKAIKEYWS